MNKRNCHLNKSYPLPALPSKINPYKRIYVIHTLNIKSFLYGKCCGNSVTIEKKVLKTLYFQWF